MRCSIIVYSLKGSCIQLDFKIELAPPASKINMPPKKEPFEKGKSSSNLDCSGDMFMGILATPSKATPPRNKGLIRPY